MALQESVAVRNAKLNAVEVTIGVDAVFRIFTGAPPANCAAANTGTELAAMTLPTDWMAAASNGSKAYTAPWADASANADGTAGHFRLYAADGTTCGLQGTITASGGGGDMIIQNTSVVTGQAVTVTAFTLTEANA